MNQTLPQADGSEPFRGSSQLRGFVLVLAALLLAALLVACIPAFGQDPPVNSEAAQWLGYNNTLDSQRFSPLKEITVKNVGDLKETCELVLGEAGAFQSGPLVVGDTMYMTTAHTTVALNAADCSVRWRDMHKSEQVDIFAVNRGLAYHDGRLFRGTPDGHLLALAANTGEEISRVRAADPNHSEFFSAAPIVWNGLVFIGAAGSDWAPAAA
jgi:alcohol dehydrogenase (cytochrome c)